MDPLFVRTHGRAYVKLGRRTSANKLASPLGGARVSHVVSAGTYERGREKRDREVCLIVFLGFPLPHCNAHARLGPAISQSPLLVLRDR